MNTADFNLNEVNNCIIKSQRNKETETKEKKNVNSKNIKQQCAENREQIEGNEQFSSSTHHSQQTNSQHPKTHKKKRTKQINVKNLHKKKLEGKNDSVTRKECKIRTRKREREILKTRQLQHKETVGGGKK